MASSELTGVCISDEGALTEVTFPWPQEIDGRSRSSGQLGGLPAWVFFPERAHDLRNMTISEIASDVGSLTDERQDYIILTLMKANEKFSRNHHAEDLAAKRMAEIGLKFIFGPVVVLRLRHPSRATRVQDPLSVQEVRRLLAMIVIDAVAPGMSVKEVIALAHEQVEGACACLRFKGGRVTAERASEGPAAIPISRPCRDFPNCKKGRLCHFAHAEPDVRQLGQETHPLRKSKLCMNFIKNGSCEYGTYCNFAHGHQELVPVAPSESLELQFEVRAASGRTQDCKAAAWMTLGAVEQLSSDHLQLAYSDGVSVLDKATKMIEMDALKLAEGITAIQNQKNAVKYNSLPCRDYPNCKKGRLCHFAHAEPDLHQRQETHPRLKSKLCRNIMEDGVCKFGANCMFAHGDHELQKRPCKYGKDCDRPDCFFEHPEGWQKQQVPVLGSACDAAAAVAEEVPGKEGQLDKAMGGTVERIRQEEEQAPAAAEAAKQAGFPSAPGTLGSFVHKVVEGLVVMLGAGDVAQLRGGVVMVVTKRVYEMHKPRFEPVGREPCPPLPGAAVALSPILDLSPHEVPFDDPVLLIVPVCTGADAAWRSLPQGGWEELVCLQFCPGFAILRLDHFCQVVVGSSGRVRAPISVRGFINRHREPPVARWAILQDGCDTCLDMMRQSRRGILKDFEECIQVHVPGSYDNLHPLPVSEGLHPEEHDEVCLRFTHFPRHSSTEWKVQGPTFSEFTIYVDGIPYTFCLPDAPAIPPPADADQQMFLVPQEGSTIQVSAANGSSDVYMEGGLLDSSAIVRASDLQDTAASLGSVEFSTASTSYLAPNLPAPPMPDLPEGLPERPPPPPPARLPVPPNWKRDVRKEKWYVPYRMKVFTLIQNRMEGGAAEVTLVGIEPCKENVCTCLEYPALLQDLFAAFHERRPPFYLNWETEVIAWNKIHKQYASQNPTTLQEQLQDFSRRGNDVIIVSAPEDQFSTAREAINAHNQRDLPGHGKAWEGWATADDMLNPDPLRQQ